MYIVGSAYMTKAGTVLGPGTAVTEDQFTPETWKQITSNGALMSAEDAAVLRKWGVDLTSARANPDLAFSHGTEERIATGAMEGAAVAPGQGAQPWAYDPSALQGKAITELNAMIMKDDASQTPMDTPAEAIAFLSQNFGK